MLCFNILNWKVFRVFFIVNFFNNVFGFGGLVGVGLWMMFYKEYMNDVKCFVVGIVWFIFLVLFGLLVFSILIVVWVFLVGEIISEKLWLWVVIVGVVLIVLAVLIVVWINNKKVDIEDGEVKLRYLVFLYIGVLFVEWFVAVVVMYYLLYVMGI